MAVLLQRYRRFFYLSGKAIASSFYDSSARLDLILRDQISGLFRGLVRASKYRELTGQVPGDIDIPQFDLEKARDRSHNQTGTSLQNTFENLPEVFLWIIRNNRLNIEKYLGRNFFYGSVSTWRNLSVPPELTGYDLYSNVWHQDNGDGNRLLHVFVFPQDITESDGPLEMVPIEHVAKMFVSDFKDRTDAHYPGTDRQMPFSTKAIGPKGTYLIMNPAISVHRAGIPSSFRDITNVTLYPEWVGQKVAKAKGLTRFPR